MNFLRVLPRSAIRLLAALALLCAYGPQSFGDVAAARTSTGVGLPTIQPLVLRAPTARPAAKTENAERPTSKVDHHPDLVFAEAARFVPPAEGSVAPFSAPAAARGGTARLAYRARAPPGAPSPNAFPLL